LGGRKDDFFALSDPSYSKPRRLNLLVVRVGHCPVANDKQLSATDSVASAVGANKVCRVAVIDLQHLTTVANITTCYPFYISQGQIGPCHMYLEEEPVSRFFRPSDFLTSVVRMEEVLIPSFAVSSEILLVNTRGKVYKVQHRT
jgi:hypothetical protein